jgi:hypothetical protein
MLAALADDAKPESEIKAAGNTSIFCFVTPRAPAAAKDTPKPTLTP